MSAPPSLLENQLRTLKSLDRHPTVGTKSNRDGIGARITVKIG